MRKADAKEMILKARTDLEYIYENLRHENDDAELSLAEASSRLNKLAAMMVDPVGASSGRSNASVECPNCKHQITVTLSK